MDKGEVDQNVKQTCRKVASAGKPRRTEACCRRTCSPLSVSRLLFLCLKPPHGIRVVVLVVRGALVGFYRSSGGPLVAGGLR